jgi:hypothetical protein
MSPLAAIYHPGAPEEVGYPVAMVHLITTWSEQTGAITEAVCVTTDGTLRVVEVERLQVVDRAVAEAIVAATAAVERQRRPGRMPPLPR